MNHHESMFEMDRRIQELEHALSVNDEYLQRLEALNAELLRLLELVLPDVRLSENRFAVRDAIVKAKEAFAPSKSFLAGWADYEAGRVVEMDRALEDKPPPPAA